MTKKKIETTEIAPGATATVGGRAVTNVSERPVHVGVSNPFTGELPKAEAGWMPNTPAVQAHVDSVRAAAAAEFDSLDGRFQALSDLGKEEFLRTGVMPSTAAVGPQEALASQTSIINAAIRHERAYGVQPEAPAPYFQPNVLSGEADSNESSEHVAAEHVAADYLTRARRQLNDIGHFETNQAVACIDKALEWLATAEATDEP